MYSHYDTARIVEIQIVRTTGFGRTLIGLFSFEFRQIDESQGLTVGSLSYESPSQYEPIYVFGRVKTLAPQFAYNIRVMRSILREATCRM